MFDPSVLNPEPELSQHFTWEEASITSHRDVDNKIPKEVEGNIKLTAKRMEAVRALLQEPIIISSWYRCVRLNTLVGGRANSQHTSGTAVDFISPRYGPPHAVVRKIATYGDLISFDQLILEHTWVHISFCVIPNVIPRRQVLTWLGGIKYAQGITDKSGKPI